MTSWVEIDHGMGSPALDVLADVQRRGDVPSHTTGYCERCGLTRPLFRFRQTCWVTVGGTAVDSSEYVMQLCARCFSDADTDVEEEVG